MATDTEDEIEIGKLLAKWRYEFQNVTQLVSNYTDSWESSSNRSFHQERRDEEKANRSFHQERRDDQIEIHCRNNEEGQEGDDAGQIFEEEYHEESLIVFQCQHLPLTNQGK